MTLDHALEVSEKFILANKLTFTPAAIIKKKDKLPIYAYERNKIHYVLKSQAGDAGYDSDYLSAKWKLQRSNDWEPRLRDNDLV